MLTIINTGRAKTDSTLDANLEEITKRCITSRAPTRPSIQDLHTWVLRGISKDAQWYRDNMPQEEANRWETDDAIVSFVQEFILNPNVVPELPPPQSTSN